jgi:hypothetical protein
MVQACEGLAEAHAATDQLSKGLTLELSGGEAVRLERTVRPQCRGHRCLGRARCPALREP